MSESPYTRHGQTVQQDQHQGTYALTGKETVFQIANRIVGDWRLWRDIVDQNSLADPLDIGDHEHLDTAPDFVRLFALTDGSGFAEVDLTTDTGQGVTLHYASPELDGDATLLVTDVDAADFVLGLAAPNDTLSGVGVPIAMTDFVDVDGTLISGRYVLMSDDDRFTLDIEFDIDTWLVLWLARSLPVRIQATQGLFELVVPTPALVTGRLA